MQMRLTQQRTTHPAVASRNARVCLVECYDGQYVRVFGPYPRVVAVPKREAWNRETPEHWRYEFWENWDDAITRHKRIEPGYSEASRRDYVCKSVAHDTAPVHVVFLDERGRVVETVFGPVEMRVGRLVLCEEISVLDVLSKLAAMSLAEQPPVAIGGTRGLSTIFSREWEAGRVLPGQRLRPVPPSAFWPALGDEPELLRNPEV